MPRIWSGCSGDRGAYARGQDDDEHDAPLRADEFLSAGRSRQMMRPSPQLDQRAFAAQLERHRRELQVHCYRMLGSYEDSEDLVQETFLRAWRARGRFGSDGRTSFRAWLYRIATNACLDVLRRRPRRVMPPDVAPAA